MNRQRLALCLVLLFVLMLTASSCGQRGASAGEAAGMQGTITVSGAWALYPMMVSWAEAFQELHPNVQFDISAGGAGKGMADALAGAVDIGMVSRAIYPEEVDKGAFAVSVVKDAVFLTVSEQNPVWEDLHRQGVSQETLTGIYITGDVTNWGQVVGRPEVSDPIHIYTRSDAAGAPATWAEYLGKKQEDLLGVGVFGDPGLLEAVIKDPLGIGYNNLNYAYDMDTGLPVAGSHVVPLDANGNGQADPEEIYDTKAQAVEAVATDAYPSPPARDLNLVSQGPPTGLVKDFMIWVLTEGQQYVDQVGYIALPQEKLDQELSRLN